jgi:hypothetical protein
MPGRKSLFSARWDVGLGAIAERRRIAAPGSGRRIENKGLGLLEFLEEPVMDFGLADQPPDDLRFRDVEGLGAIRPVAFAPWHKTRRTEKFGIGKRVRRTPLTLFWDCHHKVHRLDRTGSELVAKKASGERPCPQAGIRHCAG